MAFKIATTPTYKQQVEVYTPNQKGGHDRSTFTAIFNRANVDELDELRKMPQRDVMRRKLAGWEDFVDETNQPVEYNEDTLEVLLNVPEALMGLTQAFWESVAKGREKN